MTSAVLDLFLITGSDAVVVTDSVVSLDGTAINITDAFGVKVQPFEHPIRSIALVDPNGDGRAGY